LVEIRKKILEFFQPKQISQNGHQDDAVEFSVLGKHVADRLDLGEGGQVLGQHHRLRSRGRRTGKGVEDNALILQKRAKKILKIFKNTIFSAKNGCISML
jgi:hypothetical protein